MCVVFTVSLSVPFYLISKCPFDTEITVDWFAATVAAQNDIRKVFGLCASPLLWKWHYSFSFVYEISAEMEFQWTCMNSVALEPRDSLGCMLSSTNLLFMEVWFHLKWRWKHWIFSHISVWMFRKTLIVNRDNQLTQTKWCNATISTCSMRWKWDIRAPVIELSSIRRVALRDPCINKQYSFVSSLPSIS